MDEWLIVLIRTFTLIMLLTLIIPLIGRRPLSAMTSFDIIYLFVGASMIATIALNVINNFAFGLIGLGAWLAGLLIIQYLVQKSKTVHKYLYGKEIVVIKQGKVMEENLHIAKLTGADLLAQLRRKNIFQVADVEFAVMEANGDITALLKREQQPLTPHDMRIKVSTYQEPQTVILDGNILDEPLTTLGLNRAWIKNELAKTGIHLENVFLAQVDSMGELYIDLFNDAILVPQSTSRELLLATLKKIEADFMTYSLETKNQEWKKRYHYHAKTIHEVVEALEPHLNT